MSKKYIKPIIKETEHSRRDNEKVYEHPAFGMIGISRISCTPSITLFGSEIKHSHLISLRVKTAEKYTDGNHTFYHGRKELVEVFLTPNQFSKMLINMNCGDGVPCTINNRESDRDIPGIIDETTPITESRNAFQDRINRVTDKATSMIKKAEEILESPKACSNSDMKELKSYLASIKQELDCNMSCVANSFDEKMEKTVAQAKAEVESFVSSTIKQAGMEAIANGTYQPKLELKGND